MDALDGMHLFLEPMIGVVRTVIGIYFALFRSAYTFGIRLNVYLISE